jgi:hypothetical protein
MKQQIQLPPEVKPLNYKQLAATYEVTHKTLKGWLEPFMEEIGAMRGRTFTPRQVRMIYDKLGEPKSGFSSGTI